MNIYEKLQIARLRLHRIDIKKTGSNQGRPYFQLSDFAVEAQNIFNDVRLCGVVSFTADLATLSIRDFDGDGEIIITSPMGGCMLPKAHDVQNIGATELYQRRYLWMTALEITEHDAIDSSDGYKTVDVNKLINKYETALSGALTMPELSAIWQAIPAKYRSGLVNLKDEIKTKIAEGIINTIEPAEGEDTTTGTVDTETGEWSE